MSYEPKPGQGSIFKNDRKEKHTHPDYKGSIVDLNGQPCWISLWVKRSEGKPPFFSVSIQAKEVKPVEVETVEAEEVKNDLPF